MNLRNKHYGVVEGFYRHPYTWNERADCIRLLAETGCNTYVYGPKIDPFHRKKWYQPYPSDTLKKFTDLAAYSKSMGIRFNYALSPMMHPEPDRLIKKVRAMMHAGIAYFSVFFDDIKVPLNATTATAQCSCVNELYSYMKRTISDPVLFFCPTQYRGFKNTEYIQKVAQSLDTRIEMFWTGKYVVSHRITDMQIDRITQIYRRPPLIWDNLFANDYIPGVRHAFPYRYRSPSIIDRCPGILINPMNQYVKSKPLIRTAAMFFKNPKQYVPRKAWRKAIETLSSKR
jgi:hypothetical protein